MKILMIEDDQGIQDTVELMFKITMSEVEFLSAREGQSGLETVRYLDPDLVILDLGLPDMSGFEVIRNIRESKSTPIIVLTARSEPSTKNRCLELGADSFISKPFRRKEIIDAINTVMDGKKQVTETVI